MGTATYLDTLAHDLLDAASDGLTAARTGHPAPERVYVSHGVPAVDLCTGDDQTGQLSVYLDPARGLDIVAKPDRPRVPRQLLVQPIALFVVELWRCHPAFTRGGEIPSAAVLDDAASMLLTDLWCLETQLFTEAADGTLFTVDCHRVEVLGAQALNPQGGAAGWRLPVRVALSDTGP